jgi:hypothetical protein
VTVDPQGTHGQVARSPKAPWRARVSTRVSS